MERRTWLKGVAAGVVGAITPAHAAPALEREPAPAAAEQPASAQRFLDDHGRRTLTSLAEILVPGSVAAGVVDLIDRVATVDAAPRQRQLLNAIGRFDQGARAAHGARWIDVPPAEQIDLMRRASDAPPGARDHFEFLRTTVITAYMATEPGMKEFGWAGRNAWTEVPGCTHPNPEHE